MRKLYYILSLFLVFSCMNETKNSKDESYEDAKLNNEVFKTNEAVMPETILFTEQDIAYQKLQEFYDLNLLRLNHPEFEEDISMQIADISASTIVIPKISKAIKIQNPVQIKPAEILNDSISKLKISYDIQTDQVIQKDTITAVIKTSTIIIDDVPQKTYKVRFENN